MRDGLRFRGRAEVVGPDAIEHHARHEGPVLAAAAGRFVGEREPAVRPGARAVQCVQSESMGQQGGPVIDGTTAWLPLAGAHRLGRRTPFP
ncbi:hypothetical protein GCM10009727_71840 [Actinomadura napierensis]|uniref:Uncharacterized protein n=1 Tax=Actinomadura napierensis TaxID=267854 RepID=A0ABP5M757_9ACTN